MAVAEPRRRQILDVLVGGERPVNDLMRVLGLTQPQVSKATTSARGRGGSTTWMSCWRTSNNKKELVMETSGRTATVTLATDEQILITKEDRDVVINSGMETGMQEQMDLLEQIAISLH